MKKVLLLRGWTKPKITAIPDAQIEILDWFWFLNKNYVSEALNDYDLIFIADDVLSQIFMTNDLYAYREAVALIILQSGKGYIIALKHNEKLRDSIQKVARIVEKDEMIKIISSKS